MKTAAKNAKAPLGKGRFAKVKNVRYPSWEDAFDVEFEDGLCILEPHATIRCANKIAAKAGRRSATRYPLPGVAPQRNLHAMSDRPHRLVPGAREERSDQLISANKFSISRLTTFPAHSFCRLAHSSGRLDGDSDRPGRSRFRPGR